MEKVEHITPLTIKELLSESKYRIPIYQRNYDWGEREALQLIEDVADYAENHSNQSYYIGSVVVVPRYDKGEYYETIDGQQRLTTLTILMTVLRTLKLTQEMAWFKKVNLSYNHRPKADEALHYLWDNQLHMLDSSAGSIAEVYKAFKKVFVFRNKVITLATRPNLDFMQFLNYLLNKVIIIRIPVPYNTDLNHYFEIMNSRGEQLEKHEILKAQLMKYLTPEEHEWFGIIWEACANMNKFVQMNFNSKTRDILFTPDWSNYPNQSFNESLIQYKDTLTKTKSNNNTTNTYDFKVTSINALVVDAYNNIKYTLPNSEDDNKNEEDRFESIITFPNFLLHVLRLHYQNNEGRYDSLLDEVKLDDKRLIGIFNKALEQEKGKETIFVREFIIELLQSRYLYDQYIIKREKDTWSIKQLKKYDNSKVNYVNTFGNEDDEDDIGKDIKMLQAMFHVSAPTQIYKHWLNAILFYIRQHHDEGIKPTALRNWLQQLAYSYMLYRYVGYNTRLVSGAKQILTNFEDFIYKDRCRIDEDPWEISETSLKQSIDRGCSVENFIFNFYDYYLWSHNAEGSRNFEFTYRTSVEHFYPQTPANHENLDDDTLNCFGNLCLISRGMNSKFGNNLPMAKIENFENEMTPLSLKLQQMITYAKTNKKTWHVKEIKDFDTQVKQKLYTYLQVLRKSAFKE